MIDSLKKIFAVVGLLTIFGFSTAAAEKVNVEIDAPALVAVGDGFRVEYSVNVKPDRFIQPEQFAGFEVIAGPSSSTSQSVSIVNGNMVQESKYSYIFVLVATEEGQFTLPAAKMVVGGKEYASKALPIETVQEGGESAGRASQQGQGAGGQTQQRAAEASVKADDVLFRAVVDKTSVYRGQPVRVSLKIYYRVPIAGITDIKLPAFNGFWKQQLNTDHYTSQRETYNSKIYTTDILAEYLLFPQQSGTLQVERSDMTAIIRLVSQQQNRSIFDDFFGGGPEIREVEHRVSTAPINITVNELPSGAPAGFNGAVGEFNMTSELPEESISANSSADFRIRITGSGNLPLLQAPIIELPSSFEQYNVKTTESLTRGGTGISGYKEFEYPIIARAAGDFTLNPVSFSYFDPRTAKYVTLSTPRRDITVLPDSTGGGVVGGGGLVSGFTKEEVKVLGQDIRFIKLGRPDLNKSGKLFMGSLLYWALFLALIGLFSFALIYLQKRMELMKNVEFVRGRRANKVALQRLKQAENYMSSGDQRNFYEEMLKALWGYMSDKLNIPGASLTRESVREELSRREIPKEQINRYIELISDSEYSQYSPGESRRMQDVYANAVDVISKLESLIKR